MTDSTAPHDNLHTAQRFYDAFAARDQRALLAALTPDFRGVVADGMPGGLGRTYNGAQTMFRECWARVFTLIDLRPIPTEYLPVAPDRVVVLGRYHGTARTTHRPLCAAFAHIVRVTDGLISELIQITDSARWHDALAQEPRRALPRACDQNAAPGPATRSQTAVCLAPGSAWRG